MLAALKIDGYNQGKCMIVTTELGQLATEYLDDRKQEFQNLEQTVKAELKIHQKSLDIVRTQAKQLHHNMRYLIRRDVGNQ